MLKVNCIKKKPKPTTMDKWQKAAREEQQDYLKVQHTIISKTKHVLFHLFHLISYLNLLFWG